MPKAENDENIKSLDLPDVETESSNVENETSGVKACDDPRYATFFKMIQFGVPIQAVKLKMDTEGLDPSILE